MAGMAAAPNPPNVVEPVAGAAASPNAEPVAAPKGDGAPNPVGKEGGQVQRVYSKVMRGKWTVALSEKDGQRSCSTECGSLRGWCSKC
jgi:hypothetical protein